MVLKSHTPCRSGLPSGVRGTVDAADGAFVAVLVWAAANSGVSNAIALIRPPRIVRCRVFTGASMCLSVCLLAKMPVHELFRELHALELQDLRILFQPPIERHADRPRP